MKNRPLSLLVLILLLAASLRFHLLGAQSLWNDEGNSYVQATRSFSDIAAHAARDIHPPGYYWLLALWRLLTGESEFALRSLSVFASILTVAFTYALGRRLFGTIAGVVTALLVTLNTFSIYYAQEARMYSLLALWAAASMWALVGFLQSGHGVQVGAQRAAPLPHPYLRWALALFNAAGLWTQYAYPFVMLAQGVMVVLWLAADVIGHWVGRGVARYAPTSRTLLYYVAANLLTIALYLPWLPTAYTQATTWPNTGDPTIPIGVALGVITGWLIFGGTYTSANFSATSFLPIFLLVVLIPVSTAKRARIWWRALLPIVWVLLSIGLFLALGLFREGSLKLLLPAQIGAALWIARSVDAIWGAAGDFQPPLRYVPRILIMLAMATVIGEMWSGLYPLYHDPNFQRDDYRSIVRDITADLDIGDAIILDAPNQEEVFRYYYRGAVPVFPLPPGLGANDTETQAMVREIITGHDRVFAVFWGEAERDPNRVVEGTLDAEAFEIGDAWYGDVRLARYATPSEMTIERQSGARFGEYITLERYAMNGDTLQPGDVLQVRLDWRTDEALTTRYKVFLQLLDTDRALVAQRDSEPGGGLALTTTWTPGTTIEDNHALVIPPGLPTGEYTLIAGLYNIDRPDERLRVGNGSFLILDTITIS